MGVDMTGVAGSSDGAGRPLSSCTSRTFSGTAVVLKGSRGRDVPVATEAFGSRRRCCPRPYSERRPVSAIPACDVEFGMGKNS
jgi:hypothetical protein